MTALMLARGSYAAERRRENIVNYTDLLSATANLLRTNSDVRRAMQDKYRWILVDEFQDTDPIQAEVLILLGADEASIRQLNDADWWSVRLRPGALFLVGDPKQSIYRFRRADIDIYNRVREIVLASGGEVLRLTACWRSLPEVCQLANAVFRTVFPKQPTAEAPQFEPLDPVRQSRSVELKAAITGVAKLTIPAFVSKRNVAEADGEDRSLHKSRSCRWPAAVSRFSHPEPQQTKAGSLRSSPGKAGDSGRSQIPPAERVA